MTTPETPAAPPLVTVPEKDFTSFVDAPVCTELESLEADVAVLGVPYGMPYETGQCRSACAPAYIRQKSMRFLRARQGAHVMDTDREPFASNTVRIVDCGDVRSDPLDFPGMVGRATEAVRTILQRGAVPVALGGDDAIPIPVARAYRDFGPITVVQIDEHMDFADTRHGVREGYSSPMRRISEMEWVEQVVQIGLHGFSPADQVRDARDAGHLIVTEREVHEAGVEQILARIPDGRDYFITLDFDGLDANVCPAVSHPEPGGLTFHETVDLFGGLARKGRIAGMDFAELVPAHDLHGLGGHATARLILDTIHAMHQAGQFRQ